MVSSTMDSVGVDLEVKEKVIDNLNNTTPLFAGLGSSYKRRQLYKRKFGLVVRFFIRSVRCGVLLCQWQP